MIIYLFVTYRDRGGSLGGGDHVGTQSLWWVDALADFLLDEMHGEGELLPGQFTDLPGVSQSPAEKRNQFNASQSTSSTLP